MRGSCFEAGGWESVVNASPNGDSDIFEGDPVLFLVESHLVEFPCKYQGIFFLRVLQALSDRTHLFIKKNNTLLLFLKFGAALVRAMVRKHWTPSLVSCLNAKSIALTFRGCLRPGRRLWRLSGKRRDLREVQVRYTACDGNKNSPCLACLPRNS